MNFSVETNHNKDDLLLKIRSKRKELKADKPSLFLWKAKKDVLNYCFCFCMVAVA
jgi:hypothetical protein